MGFIRDIIRLFIDFEKKFAGPVPESKADKIFAQGPRDRETLLADIKQTMEFLKDLGVEVTAEPEESVDRMSGEKEFTVDLPNDPESDYMFQLYYCPDWQRNIGAKLIDKETGKPLDLYLWGLMLEIWGHDSFEELIDKFNNALKLVVENETRVIQQDEGRCWTFRCEARVDGNWVKVPGHFTAFKEGGFKFPEVDGLVKLYYSKPLAPKRK